MDNDFILNINSLLINPTGKNTSFMASRQRIIENLNFKYEKLLLKHKKFDFKVFKYKKDSYLFKFLIPSETKENLFYDIFLLFSPNEASKDDKSILRYDLKLFSNSPDFMFTYTYVLNENGFIIDFLKPKCSSKALKEAPTVKNPVETHGFEKSCYYACLYLKKMELLKKFDLDKNIYVFDKSKILKEVSSQETKLKEYNMIKNKKQAKPKSKKLPSTTRKQTISRKDKNKK